MINKISIIIPAYNEEKTISKVIKDLKDNEYNDIVVIDDGSKDNTSETAKKAGATVLKHIINRGQGAALKTGFDYALNQNANIVITFDADGQHLASEIKNLILPIIKDSAEVTLGSRFLKKIKMPFIRRLFLKAGAFIFLIMYGIKLTDSHNGFRAISRKALQKIELKTDGMEHASEIVEEIAKKKIKYKEVPVTILYTNYSKAKGQSTWNAFRIFFRMVLNKIIK